ncbi:MAG: SWIM zinc finger family protein [Candidatus Thiodiazotropha sp. (ex Troendleina suluensis)]|nr:SWIM zinc finger family protein [Candidatus Thiodiazotropha sp. (ex Troendleina suluensis)]
MALSDHLTNRRIRQWAGGRSFERGQAYFEEGLVSALKERNGRIGASVRGTHNYRVTLWEEDDTTEYACNCPVGLRGDFCKHCVATALAWLERQAPADKANTGKRKKQKKTEAGLTLKEVRAWLLLQKKAALVDMLLDASGEDEQLHSQLMLKAAAAKGVNLTTYRKVIDQAIGGGGFIDYYQMYDYWRGVDSAIDAIAELLDQGHTKAVIELSEYALSGVEKAIEQVDDSDGYMSMLLDRLQEMHLAACRKAKPDPEALAERLFEWELNGEWDTFYGAVKTYSRVLGRRGVQRYRELAEAEWARVKPLKPGEEDRNRYGKRFRITHIMESLAEQSGDVEGLVTIKQRDLSSSYNYLEIAEIYRKARQGAKALEWAEKGIQIFGKESDSRLQDLLAELYHRRKRHEEAMALIWPQFERQTGLMSYQKLKKHADRNKTWPEWRDRALKFLRAVIKKEAKKTTCSRWNHAHRWGHSNLVEIFLWEKDIEAAWQEAQAGGCSEGLWLQLAELREKEHPKDAIAVYWKQIGPIVEQTNNEAYAEAAGLLRRVEKLMKRLGEQAAFQQYLNTVRTEYKRKRNFMKLLDKF